MRRILIIGSAGAGKSVLSQWLGAALGLPVIHLDAHYWKPGWVPSENQDWKDGVMDLIQGDRWIMDGNYGGTIETRVAAADTVIFLALPRLVCLYRAVKRSVRDWGGSRPDLGDGCKEKLPDWEFLKWIWTYPEQRTPKILAMLEGHREVKRVVVLQSAREVCWFMEQVTSSSTEASEG